ncbi:S8 family peptidase [Salinithrix halophila]|uniref:S8 family peptidase n=1 Tax=Salinithrix halophila TaxID=1485204 RepID=A0ABV8JDC7_9BACL
MSALAVMTLALTLVVLPSSPAAASRGEKTKADAGYQAGEIVVKFKQGAAQTKRLATLDKLNSKILSKNHALGFDVVKVHGSVENALKMYRENPLVEYAEPNITFKAAATPNDSDYSKQYGLELVNAPTAWKTVTGKGAKIAIVDTGVDYNHPDLKGKVIKGRDFIDNDSDPMDENGHGTHCAGIAAAHTNNEIGIAGMAPNAKIYASRVLDANGRGSLDAVANGITDAADHGAKVISLSLGASKGAQALKDAVDYAADKGAIVVAAAGNEGKTTPNYPGYYKKTIAVGATDSNDKKADFSNCGADWVDVAAPGVDIYSTITGGGYKNLSGTSMATPHVAGLAGLLASQGKKAADIRSTIEGTADKISGTGSDWAYGRINAAKAVGE